MMNHKNDEKIKTTKSSGNVFKDLELPDSDKYMAKVKLAFQINNILENRKLIQLESAKLLGIDQPKVSALSSGKLDDFSIERLIGFLNKLDHDVDIVVKKKETRRKTHGQLRVAFC